MHEDNPSLEAVKPNLLIIGSEKCGTTSLHDYIGQHPEIFMSKAKELYYFDDRPRRRRSNKPRASYTFDLYLQNFIDGANHRYRGESTPTYLICDSAPVKIKTSLGAPKMIVMMRNPVDRAESHFWHQTAIGNIDWGNDFSGYIRSDFGRELTLQRGLFHHHIHRFLEHHARENFFFGFQSDLLTNGQDVCRQIFQFLGVDPDFCPNMSERKNTTAVIASSNLRRCLRSLARVYHPIESMTEKTLNLFGVGSAFQRSSAKMRKKVLHGLGTKPARMSLEDEQYLIDYYRDDVIKLQQFLNRDLSHWLEPRKRN